MLGPQTSHLSLKKISNLISMLLIRYQKLLVTTTQVQSQVFLLHYTKSVTIVQLLISYEMSPLSFQLFFLS